MPSDLHFLTGVEISAQTPPEYGWGGSLHILGYGLDPEHEDLVHTLEKYQRIRDERTHRILDRLHELGITLSLEQVLAEVGEGAASRPHVASAMVRAGIVADIEDAFQKYLKKGRPAYVGKQRLDCRRSFELISAAGGIPVLAHPGLIPCRDANELVRLIESLCRIGLKGLEVYYPDHPPEAVARYLEMAEQYNLAVTGGSDFHGQLTPEVRMGKGSDDMVVPYTVFEHLVSHHSLTYV